MIQDQRCHTCLRLPYYGESLTGYIKVLHNYGYIMLKDICTYTSLYMYVSSLLHKRLITLHYYVEHDIKKITLNQQL